MSTVDEVKQRLDITELVGQYVTLSKSGRNFKGVCPFHQEKTPSFFVFPDQQRWHCFGACNTGGDIFTFIMKKEGVEFREALEMLASRVGVEIESGPRPDKEKHERIYQANQAAAQFFREQLESAPAAGTARAYLKERDISLEIARRFQLGYSPAGRDILKKHLVEVGFSEADLLSAGLVVETDDGNTRDRFRNRLMFPIVDIKKRINGFGGRVLDKSQPKYLNTPQSPVFDKSSNLYAIDLAVESIRREGRAVLMEGYMDVIAAHSFNYSNVVAVMGTAVTEAQIDRLKKMTRNLVLALDSDAAGMEAMARCVAYENRVGAEVKLVLLTGAKDPDEQIRKDPESWPALVDGAVPLIDHIFTVSIADLDLRTAAGKSNAVARLGAIVNDITDDVRRDHYVGRLAEITAANYRSIEAALAKMKTTGRRPVKAVTRSEKEGALITTYRLEEDFLALLLKHYELKTALPELAGDYFEDVKNREIYRAYINSEKPDDLRVKVDETLWEHLDGLSRREVSEKNIEKRVADNLRRLEEKYLRRMKENSASILESEGLTDEELHELMQSELKINERLNDVFTRKRSGE
jgi:DNA primase